MSSHIVNEFDASVGFQPRVAQSYNHVKGNRPVNYEEIECVINGDYSVEGRKEGNEVYMPFSFIQNYFEVIMFDFAQDSYIFFFYEYDIHVYMSNVHCTPFEIT